MFGWYDVKSFISFTCVFGKNVAYKLSVLSK